MYTASKLAIAASVAVVVLASLLIAANAQQPDYTAQCSNGIAVPDPQNNPGLVQDCAALLVARDAFAADPPLDWSADTSIHDWEGVDINSILEGAYFRNRVVSLNLNNSELMGSISPNLGDLANLTHLSLRSNHLTGVIPPEIGKIANLYELSLNDNQLTGSIPSELGNLSGLYYLRLQNNQLTGSIPPELGNISVGFLYLAGNQLTGCIPSMLADVSHNDFGSLGLPLCNASDTLMPTPTPSVTPIPTPAATPVPPAVPAEVLNRISTLETLVTTLQGLISTLEGTISALNSNVSALASRVAALEADASRPTPVPTPTPVPGETPVPTPTQTPVADACLTGIASGGATNGSWNSTCTTDRNLITPNAPVGTRYTGYYTFALSQRSEVTITLESSEDTYLFLLSGHGRNGSVIEQNDDIDSGAQNYNSRIVETLAPGEYTIVATTYNLATTGDFTLTVTGLR